MLPLPLNSKMRPQFMKRLWQYVIVSFGLTLILALFGFAKIIDIMVIPFVGAATIFYGYGFIYGVSGLMQPKIPLRTPDDLSVDASPTPIAETAIESAIEGLGFKLFGKLGNDSVVHTWLYINETGEILLKMSSSGATRLYSIYKDGFMNETISQEITYISKTPLQQFKNIYNTHRRAIEASKQKHGNPLPISSVQMWIDWESKFGYPTNRDHFLQHTQWWGAFMLIFVPIWIVYFFQKLPMSGDAEFILSAIPISCWPFMVILFVKSGVLGKTKAELQGRKNSA